MGFDVIDAIADKYNITMDIRKHRAFCGKGIIGGQKVILAKPQTYMNLSGESVRSLVDYFKIDEEQELIVIYNDIVLMWDNFVYAKKEVPEDDNGIKNIIAHLGHSVFPRIKVGVGEKPKHYDLADYVLGHFSKAEREVMEKGYEKAVEAVELMVNDEIETAMNKFNKKAK